jgi:hypothetical protein
MRILSTLLILINASALKPQQLEAPDFSVNRGFYENSFNVIVTSQPADATIKYTMDGSDPETSQSAQIQNSPATIQIDPDLSYGLHGKTPGVTLRACAVAPGYTMSESVTHTYLFINKIGELSPDGIKPGPGWPNPSTSGQYIIYGMDQNVLNDSRYNSLIDSAMLSVPTISLVTDLKNLFDPDSGIYMNAMSDGKEWERPASIELLNPDGSEGFQINAGLRIRGGYSRHNENPKHAFRLFFRSEYGKGKLKYPLFEEEGVEEFDKIDLRTSQNYSWSYPGHQGEVNTMNRDVFSRDLQGKIGQPYTRSRYYHLYINGYYWGLFQSQERPEARFATSYFGGIVEDYDVVKNGDNYIVDATDGNLDAYNIVWNLCVSGFQNNTNYFRLQGLNPDRTVNPDYNVLVDLNNLIDYMLIIFYGGNFDSPTTKFGQNKNPNNFYCIYNRNGNDGFRFFVHDAEHTLRTTSGEGPGIGLNENRVNIGNLPQGDSYRMVVSDFTRFHPQWLHFKLADNAEYRMRFADHVYKHFFNQGYMTLEKTAELFMSRAKEIEMAIIGESARWGDTYHNPPRTKDDDWLPAINDIVTNYFPNRTDIVLNQLKDQNLYPDIDPPIFENNSNEILVNSLEVETGYVVKLINPNNTAGSIQYTLDSQDPRLTGGNISGSAIDGGDEIEITVSTTTVINARVLNGTTWSAIHKIILFTDNEVENIKITEIHYHPLDNDSVSDNEYEFLELKNTGTVPANISGMSFVDGINYTFPDGITVDPNQFIVLASNRQEFNERYGFIPFGEYFGQLDNGGESITLIATEIDTVFSISYSDQAPWPLSPDGSGYSLTPKEINPTSNLNDPSNWRASYEINGSPGRDDLHTSVEDLKALPTKIELSQNYPNPFNPETKIIYTLKRYGKVRLSVFDILGREVEVLVNSVQNGGRYEVIFTGSNLASGIYTYRLKTADAIITKKMVLLK